MLNELSEWVNLLLIEEGDEVVAEATHFGVPVGEKLLHEAFLAHLLCLCRLLYALKLSGRLCESALASLLFVDQHDKSALFLAG